MKTTGIVRKIDELGRIVIPKEIRKVLKINNGNPLEIFVEDNIVMLRKFSKINNISDYAIDYANALYQTTGTPILITNKDTIIAAPSDENKFKGKKLNSELYDKILSHEFIHINSKEGQTTLPIIKGDRKKYTSQMIVPINFEGHVIGSIILFLDKTVLTPQDKMNAKVASQFLSNQISL